MMARTIPVHFVTPDEKMTTSPSIAAIQRAMRTRWRRRRPPRPGSTVGCETLVTGSTVPGWWREPGLAETAERALCGVRVGAVEEEPIERGSGSGDVGAEGSRGFELARERRAREVVRRGSREGGRGRDPRKCGEGRAAAPGAAALAGAGVEGTVDVRRRGLLHVAWQQQDDPEVLWEL